MPSERVTPEQRARNLFYRDSKGVSSDEFMRMVALEIEAAEQAAWNDALRYVINEIIYSEHRDVHPIAKKIRSMQRPEV